MREEVVEEVEYLFEGGVKEEGEGLEGVRE